MCTAQRQLWQHFEKFRLFCLQWQFSPPQTSHIKLLALMSASRKDNCASTLVEVILGYQSEIPSKHCPKFHFSMWQLWLWLPSSWPTVSVGLSLAAGALAVSLPPSLFHSVFACHVFFFPLLLSLFLWMANWPVHLPLPLVCVRLSQGLCVLYVLACRKKNTRTHTQVYSRSRDFKSQVLMKSRNKAVYTSSFPLWLYSNT